MGLIFAALDALTRERPRSLMREAIDACTAKNDDNDNVSAPSEDAYVQCEIVVTAPHQQQAQEDADVIDKLRARLHEQASHLERAHAETRELRVEVERATAEVADVARRCNNNVQTSTKATSTSADDVAATTPSSRKSRVVFVLKNKSTSSVVASPLPVTNMTPPPTSSFSRRATGSSSRDLVATTLSSKLSGAQARVKRLEADNKALHEKLRASEAHAIAQQRHATPSDEMRSSLRNTEHAASILRRSLEARTKECVALRRDASTKEATIQKLEKKLTYADENENIAHGSGGSSSKKKAEKLEKLLLVRESELRAANAELRSLRRSAAGRSSPVSPETGGLVFSPSLSRSTPLSSSSSANKDGVAEHAARFASYQSPLFDNSL